MRLNHDTLNVISNKHCVCLNNDEIGGITFKCKDRDKTLQQNYGVIVILRKLAVNQNT